MLIDPPNRLVYPLSDDETLLHIPYHYLLLISLCHLFLLKILINCIHQLMYQISHPQIDLIIFLHLRHMPNHRSRNHHHLIFYLQLINQLSFNVCEHLFHHHLSLFILSHLHHSFFNLILNHLQSLFFNLILNHLHPSYLIFILNHHI